MRDRFTPPFTLRAGEEAFWLEDAAGLTFAYTYFRDDVVVGTNAKRPTRRAALQMTKLIARAPEWAKRPAGDGA